jgi:hypothetical protein
MLDLIRNSGAVGLALIVITLSCIAMIARRSLRQSPAAEIARTRGALLFWGILAVLLGFVGHTIGIYTALGVMLESESIDALAFQSALRISLFPMILGFVTLLIAAGGWYALGQKISRLDSLAA